MEIFMTQPSRISAGLYLHIPFCVSRCLYCDFLSTTLGSEMQSRYFSVLRREILHAASLGFGKKFRILSVFFGGGTPSLPDAMLIADILDTIRSCFELAPDAEITLECNPGTLNDEKLHMYRKAGINRLSIGLQSADNKLLKSLGRIHDFETFRREYTAARDAGFQNISVDLMYDLPGQSREQFRDTLRQVLSLPDPPQHLSAYSLIIEPGTPFWERYHEDAERKALGECPLFLPSEDEEAGMLSDLKSILSGTGFHRYEISNWALNGFESVHNKGYWERRPYLGFGLGASSQADHMRWKNTSDLNEYLSCSFARKEVTHLSRSNEMEETMFLGLREMKGVTRQHFQEQFGVSMDEVYGRVLSNLTELHLLSDDGSAVRLTDRGISISNVVLAEFLLD